MPISPGRYAGVYADSVRHTGRQAQEDTPVNNTTVWRVDLDVANGDYRKRQQFPATSERHAEAIYNNYLLWPLDGYATVSLVADCRLVRKQMLHGDQEEVS